jgi:hypothetical protein
MPEKLGLPNHRTVLVDGEGYEVKKNPGASDWAFWDEVQDRAAHLLVKGVPDQSHYVTSISASFDQPVIGRLSLRDGPLEKASWFVHGSLHLSYPVALPCDQGTPLEVTLSLPDGLNQSVCLSVVLSGYTR